jgi:zinc and cadmium transporter
LHTLAWILASTALGGLLSALVAALFLLVPADPRSRVLPHLVSFATGALLGAALLGLIPEAIERAGLGRVNAIGLTVVVGIAAFFVMEKLLIWRHAHAHGGHGGHDHGGHDHAGHAHGRVGHAEPDRTGPLEASGEDRARATGTLVVVGDGIHNALDGVLIAAAFLTDLRLGIVTALAVIVHEIPQEVGDFAVLLHSGFGPRRALLLNLASSLTSMIGGTIAYFGLKGALGVLPYALAIAAASLLYIAVADLMPGLHRRLDIRHSIAQVLLIAAGVALVALVEDRVL